ncbi:LacI family DNA-binding transcriptional regulator [Flectobacillus major]|jgi:LacI family transcriptional regulator|uniref:LacI family DNA-binding transcriptional regulator n=1 Tax=Flectobacillus major TaxID=103 RepID=UPI00041A1EEE|nr:LacI family DNA-binding transcriptional regulator [Flectobacillus major]
MKSTQVTIKDIAKALNISISTVSRALRGLPEIHPDTRKAVLKLAEELDYQPNQLAKNLAKSRTKTIGVIVPNLSYYFFSAALNSIEEAAMQAGYSVLVCQSHESYLREVTNIQNLLRGQVEGLIISLARDTNEYEHINRLVRKNIPLVLFDRYSDGLSVSKVIVNNRESAFVATEHLINNGCKNIGFLAGPPNMLLSKERMLGYQDALKQHNLPFLLQNIAHSDFTQDNTVVQTLELLNRSKIDGIVAVSDRIAYSAMYALKQKGIQVPEDIAIVSFNNEPICTLLSPTLSSISQPIQDMGNEAVRILINQIEAEEDVIIPVETKILPTQLIIRESSGFFS